MQHFKETKSNHLYIPHQLHLQGSELCWWLDIVLMDVSYVLSKPQVILSVSLILHEPQQVKP